MVAPKDKGNNTVDDKGFPLWRNGTGAARPYWKEAHNAAIRRRFLDADEVTPSIAARRPWLNGQSSSPRRLNMKSHVGLTFIRDSTVPA